MPNPTVRRERILADNGDGTVTEVFRSIRQNGDRSEMVFYRESGGAKLLIWHVVYEAGGLLVHGPHEKFRGKGVETVWPPKGYE
jgi:hypothetical protein